MVRFCLSILCFVILGLGTSRADNLYMGGARGFKPFTDGAQLCLNPGQDALLELPDYTANSFSLTGLFSAPDEPGFGEAGFTLIDRQGRWQTLLVGVNSSNDELYGDERVSVRHLSEADTTLTVTRFSPHDYHLDQYAVFTLSYEAPLLRIFAGRNADKLLWESQVTDAPEGFAAVGFATGNGPVDVYRGNLLTESAVSLYDESLTPSEIQGSLARTDDPHAGYWTVLDYDMDDTMMRLGGTYTLALLPDNRDGYRLYYLTGAKVSADDWQPGALKGTLTATAVPGVYTLNWLDAEHTTIDPGATLQFTADGLATVTFPTLHSALRLLRAR